MFTRNQIHTLPGATAYDQAGHRVGTVADIYLDQATSEPQWLTIRTGLFGMKENFVPLTLARLRGDRQVTLATGKDIITAAPAIDPDGGCPRPKNTSSTATTGWATADGAASRACPRPAAPRGPNPPAARAARARTPPGPPPMRR